MSTQSKSHDIKATREVVMRARDAGLGINPGLVLAILQELEETRAKHRKEWDRAEDAERRLSAAVERKEICRQRPEDTSARLASVGLVIDELHANGALVQDVADQLLAAWEGNV